jgi:hypothetical protein
MPSLVSNSAAWGVGFSNPLRVAGKAEALRPLKRAPHSGLLKLVTDLGPAALKPTPHFIRSHSGGRGARNAG